VILRTEVRVASGAIPSESKDKRPKYEFIYLYFYFGSFNKYGFVFFKLIKSSNKDFQSAVIWCGLILLLKLHKLNIRMKYLSYSEIINLKHEQYNIILWLSFNNISLFFIILINYFNLFQLLYTFII